MNNDWQKAEKLLKAVGVIVAPTDTLYGILASALNKNAVRKVYKIKGRNEKKPLIVLITDFSDLKKFNIKLSENQNKLLNNFWPGKVSVVLGCENKRFSYLHRGTKTIAFRMIGSRNKFLFNILNKVGPLVAPSANPQGLNPAKNITEAKKYFGSNIDLYINGGTKVSKPSTLITFKNDKIVVLRQGSVNIKKD